MLKHKNFGKKVKKRKIACWTGFPNFGDMFNLYVARYVFRWCVVPGWKEADLWCVGSLLSRLFEVRHENGKTLERACKEKSECRKILPPGCAYTP